MISSRSDNRRLPPGSDTIAKVAAGLTPARGSVADALSSFELPQVFLDSFTPPFEELGYAIARAELSADRAPRPFSYTSAKKSQRELQLLHLPPIFFEPRED